uniref:Uncharacterized protein n=1 Tax=Ixodes ricinus TaxID=34613 RepID=A0A6B0UV79_IXORI
MGSIQCLFRPAGIESISASLCCCFCSLRSFARADCIMAACAREPSGFLTILTGLRSCKLDLPWPLRNGGSSSTSSISRSSSSSSSLGSIPVDSSKSGSSDLSMQFAESICLISHFSGEEILWTRRRLSTSSSSGRATSGREQGRSGFRAAS